MANNPDRPNGAIVKSLFSGSPVSGAVRDFVLDGSHAAIYRGDLVQMTADGYLDVYAAAETHVIGVCVGVEIDRGLSAATEHPGYMPANIAGTIKVMVAPDAILEMQEDGVTDPIELADIGATIEIINGGGSTLTGVSGMELDSNTHATTATLPLKLLQLTQRENNVQGDASEADGANARWDVTFNNHSFRNTTGL